jgi:hypothetical protein
LGELWEFRELWEFALAAKALATAEAFGQSPVAPGRKWMFLDVYV